MESLENIIAYDRKNIIIMQLQIDFDLIVLNT